MENTGKHASIYVRGLIKIELWYATVSLKQPLSPTKSWWMLMCGIQLCMLTCPVIARRKMCLNSFRFAVYAVKINFLSSFLSTKRMCFFKHIKLSLSLNLWIHVAIWIMRHFILDGLISEEKCVCIYYWMKLLLNLQILHFYFNVLRYYHSCNHSYNMLDNVVQLSILRCDLSWSCLELGAINPQLAPSPRMTLCVL